MSAYRQQVLIDAPVEAVWSQVGNPNRYPSWAGDVVEVSELDEVAEGAQFRQRMNTPLGESETQFVVEQLDDMREIKVRCLMSGYYLRWLLTEAGDDTFAEVEVGMDPNRIRDRAFDATLGKRWYRSIVDETLEHLRAAIG